MTARLAHRWQTIPERGMDMPTYRMAPQQYT